MSARLALALALLAAPGASAAVRACGDCGLVIVAMDDVRADRVGGTGSLTPRLDAFFSSGTVFTQAISQAPWSLPSYMSLMTSQDPSRHGVLNKYADFMADPPVLARLQDTSPGTLTLAEILRARGFRTAAFTGGAALGRGFGFGDGFEVYSDSVNFAGFDATVPQALAWLKTLKPGERFFLFVHGYDAHPFHAGRSTAAEDRRFRKRREDQLEGKSEPASAAEKADVARLYDAGVRALDARLAPLLAALDAPPLRGRAVVVALSDHGEELFDHGGIDHGLTLNDELIRVALMLRAPGAAPARVAAQVRLIDVLPTALELLGVPEPPAVCAQRDGVSLVPLLDGRPLALDAFSETDFLLASSLRAVRGADGWKLVYDLRARRARLYDLRSDPRETRDLSSADADRAALLEARLLTAYEGARAERGAAVCAGPWKLAGSGAAERLFDLRTDPLQARDLAAARPEIVRSLRSPAPAPGRPGP